MSKGELNPCLNVMVNRNNFLVGKKTREGHDYDDDVRSTGSTSVVSWPWMGEWFSSPSMMTKCKDSEGVSVQCSTFSAQQLDFHTKARQVPQSLICNWANTVGLHMDSEEGIS